MYKEYTLKLFVRACTQMDGQEGEPLRFIYTARLLDEGGAYTLSYEEGEGEERSRVSLSFREEERKALLMRREGATDVQMYFAVGIEHKPLYTVRGAGTLPIKIRAKQVENTLSPAGGHIKLAYEMEIGGARQENTLEMIAKPIGEGE